MKNEIIKHIIDIEGRFVDDPNDSGGATKYGITEKVARAFGYKGRMSELPYHVAFLIYESLYWTKIKGDQLSPLVAREVMDTAVNMGVHRAGTFLQRALNSLNDSQLTIDGRIGPNTIEALNQYNARRDELVLVKALNCLQGAYYISLTEKRVKDRRFVYGWLKNRVVI